MTISGGDNNEHHLSFDYTTIPLLPGADTMNRRDFVKKTGAAAAMIAVAPSVAIEEIPAQPEFTYESFCEFAEAMFNYSPPSKIVYIDRKEWFEKFTPVAASSTARLDNSLAAFAD